MMKTLTILTLASIVLWNCDSSLTDAQKIIDKTIAASGGDNYQHSKITFDFRDRQYVAYRKGGAYSYERIFEDTLGTIHDYVTMMDSKEK